MRYRHTDSRGRSCGGRDVCTNSDQIVCTYCFRKTETEDSLKDPFITGMSFCSTAALEILDL